MTLDTVPTRPIVSLLLSLLGEGGQQVDAVLGLRDDLARRRAIAEDPPVLHAHAHARRPRGQSLELDADRSVAGRCRVMPAVPRGLVGLDLYVPALERGQRRAAHADGR